MHVNAEPYSCTKFTQLRRLIKHLSLAFSLSIHDFSTLFRLFHSTFAQTAPYAPSAFGSHRHILPRVRVRSLHRPALPATPIYILRNLFLTQNSNVVRAGVARLTRASGCANRPALMPRTGRRPALGVGRALLTADNGATSTKAPRNSRPASRLRSAFPLYMPACIDRAPPREGLRSAPQPSPGPHARRAISAARASSAARSLGSAPDITSSSSPARVSPIARPLRPSALSSRPLTAICLSV